MSIGPLVYERMDPALFDADSPMTVHTAWTTFANALHLVDSACQTRINWVGGSTSHDDMLEFDNRFGLWYQEFIHTWFDDETPSNLDIRVAARTSGGSTPTLDIIARVVPAAYAIGAGTALELCRLTGSTTSGTPSYVIDDQVYFPDPLPDIGAKADYRIQVVEGAAIHVARVKRMRLEIEAKESTSVSSPTHGIVGVMLREFP